MRFACRPVTADFFATAPIVFRHGVDVPASAATVFSYFEDERAWPEWFSDITRVVWTSPRPFGVGTTRTVSLKTVTVDEHFFRWEPGRRFSFFLTGATLPIFEALAEDYLLEESGPTSTRFTYTVAIAPRLLIKLGGAMARRQLDDGFRRGCVGLAEYARRRA